MLALGLVGAAGAAYWSGSSTGGYVVRPGDSLWAIAASHGTTVARLASANGLNPAAILPIGKVLTIPGSSSVSSSSGTSSSRSTALLSASLPTASVRAEPASQFCADLRTGYVPVGVVPAGLAASPSRLALVPIFDRWAAHYGLDPALLKAIAWQESGWQQGLVSSTGAIGIGQIEPYTAQFISTALVGIQLNPNSISDNIRLSAAFLAYLLRVEGGSRCAAIAAYYEGPVQLAEIGAGPDTRQYVADVEALIPRFQ